MEQPTDDKKRAEIKADSEVSDRFTYVSEGSIQASLPAQPCGVGSYIRIEARIEAESRIYLGQVRKEERAADSATMRVTLRAPLKIYGSVRPSVTRTAPERATVVRGEGRLLGTLSGQTFSPLGPDEPVFFERAAVSQAASQDVQGYLGKYQESAGWFTPGVNCAGRRIDAAEDPVKVQAWIPAMAFESHTFMCGQSGVGKSTGLKELLKGYNRLCKGKVIVLDPNADFISLDVRGLTVCRPTSPTIGRDNRPNDRPLNIGFHRFEEHMGAALLGLDPLNDREEYFTFSTEMKELASHGQLSVDRLMQALQEAEKHNSPTARQLRLRLQNQQLMKSSIWEAASADALHDIERGRFTVCDLLRLSNQERIAFSLGLLSYLWKRNTEKFQEADDDVPDDQKIQPEDRVVIVIDEAHNICPPVVGSRAAELTVQYIRTIAAEGRKFGLAVFLSTQSPAKIADNVISECRNLVLMQLSSARDRDLVAAAFPGAPDTFIQRAADLAPRQALIHGNIAPGAERFIEFVRT
jgi:hypothetical protein